MSILQLDLFGNSFLKQRKLYPLLLSRFNDPERYVTDKLMVGNWIKNRALGDFTRINRSDKELITVFDRNRLKCTT